MTRPSLRQVGVATRVMDSWSASLSVTVLKIMILGDVNVGKTSLLRRFHENSFDDSRFPTPAAGVDFFVHNIDVDGKVLKVQDRHTECRQTDTISFQILYLVASMGHCW